MAIYEGRNKQGVLNFVDVTTNEVASDAFDNLSTPANPIPKYEVSIKTDFSLIDTNYENQYSIDTKNGWTFFGTALNRKAFVHKFNLAVTAGTGNFAGQTFLGAAEAPRIKFNFNKQKILTGINAHFGRANHPDYTVSKIPLVIAKCLQGQFNIIFDEYSSAGQSMQPATGNHIMEAIAAAEAAGIDYGFRVSITGATGGGTISLPTPRQPAVQNAKFVGTAVGDSSSWNKTVDIDPIYADYFIRGGNIARLHPNRRYYCIASEPDNLNVQLRIKSGTGASEIPVIGYDADGMAIYGNTSNSGTVIWDARWLPPAIAAVAGYNNGIKSVNPNAITFMNHSGFHFGLNMAIYREVKRSYPMPVPELTGLNWEMIDWYSTEEGGTMPKSVLGLPADIPSKGWAIESTYRKFVKTGLCEAVGMLETGYKKGFKNLNLTEEDYTEIVSYKQYENDARSAMVCTYEALDETNDRNGQGFEATLGVSDAALARRATFDYTAKKNFVNTFI